MDKKILEFAGLLRKAGIKISHSEVADCLKALVLTGLDKSLFYNVLAATLIKDNWDYPIFDKIFHYYFDSGFFGHQIISDNGCSGNDLMPGITHHRSTGFGVGQGLATQAIDDFVQIIKIGNPDQMLELVKKGVQSLGRISEEDLCEPREAIRQVKVWLEWNMAAYNLERQAESVDESLWLIWQERLAQLESMLYCELEKALISEIGQAALDTILLRGNLNQLDFYRLSAPQVAEIKKKISKLAHKLASRLSFRQKRANRGTVNLPKTIRKSISTGGIPIKLAFRDRYPIRPEIVVLCDLSGSVKVFSEFMLQLMYSIQNRFVHVRSFVFVDTPDEVTQYMKDNEIEEGIKGIYNNARFFKTAFSDYGQMFLEFCDKYFDVLNKKVTLLIVGDARNNYYKNHIDYMEKICGEVKKTIWLNPEPIENWGTEDSVIQVYGKLCSQVFECRNLAQLDYVAKKIV
jgi:uncharacterized protein with von Willebrand factor type A (vWA) domain